ncbi:hypothetical protein [Scatolibacter rhodanostii]|uniref:hypothetical protein n=1 Tax=Scatolibacter rhodanostii TaxID=2014781 RepID=UPI0013562F51|nr:hypothetical protein [Scatolibacter rhodanostii]
MILSEIPHKVSPFFIAFLKGCDDGIHGETVVDKGERPMFSITAMGSRVPA